MRVKSDEDGDPLPESIETMANSEDDFGKAMEMFLAGIEEILREKAENQDQSEDIITIKSKDEITNPLEKSDACCL